MLPTSDLTAQADVPSAAMIAAGPCPIFIIDDDPGSQLLIAQALSDCDLVNPVVALLDGDDALLELHRLASLGPSHLPRLVFLDWQLPSCEGVEVLQAMRHAPALRNVPVVMLSADDDAHQVIRAYALGASSYLVKPLAFSALCGVVRNLSLRWQIV